MSILAVIKSPAGMVVASDSRLVVFKDHQNGNRETCTLDWAEKVFVPGPPNTQLAIGFYGAAGVGTRGVGDLIADWARTVQDRRPVSALAEDLHRFLFTKNLGETCLMMAGFDEATAFGQVFEILPKGVAEVHGGTTGITLGGQAAVARAIQAQLTTPLELWPLRGSAQFARYLIQAEIDAQAFSLGFAGVGGDVQVAVLERGQPARKETL